MVKIYGTLGPSCEEQEVLEAMLEEGLTGIRINLSHTTLEMSRERIGNYRRACEKADVPMDLMIDLHGPEMRTGWMRDQVKAFPGDLLILRGKKARDDYPVVSVPPVFMENIETGDHILVRDGEVELEVIEELELAPMPDNAAGVTEEEGEEGEEALKDEESLSGSSPEEPESAPPIDPPSDGPEDGPCAEGDFQEEQGDEAAKTYTIGRYKRFLCRTIRGGRIHPQQSVKIVGKEVYGDVLTSEDLANLDLAAELGVTSIMQPFVRDGSDIQAVRAALEERGLQARIFAKIESAQGLENLDSIMEQADEIVIARGDLGNSMPLWELPRVQVEISRRCKEAGCPFMVVTQMLQSMMRKSIPTRAEVSDIFHAVLDGASSVMVTGETSVGEYPVGVIHYLALTAHEAEDYLESLKEHKEKLPPMGSGPL